MVTVVLSIPHRTRLPHTFMIDNFGAILGAGLRQVNTPKVFYRGRLSANVFDNSKAKSCTYIFH